MKDVIGELSKTDVSGIFSTNRATKIQLESVSNVLEIKIEGKETQILKETFDAMSALSLFELTNNNRAIITLSKVNRVAAPTNNFSWQIVAQERNEMFV